MLDRGIRKFSSTVSAAVSLHLAAGPDRGRVVEQGVAPSVRAVRAGRACGGCTRGTAFRSVLRFGRVVGLPALRIASGWRLARLARLPRGVTLVVLARFGPLSRIDIAVPAMGPRPARSRTNRDTHAHTHALRCRRRRPAARSRGTERSLLPGAPRVAPPALAGLWRGGWVDAVYALRPARGPPAAAAARSQVGVLSASESPMRPARPLALSA